MEKINWMPRAKQKCPNSLPSTVNFKWPNTPVKSKPKKVGPATAAVPPPLPLPPPPPPPPPPPTTNTLPNDNNKGDSSSNNNPKAPSSTDRVGLYHRHHRPEKSRGDHHHHHRVDLPPNPPQHPDPSPHCPPLLLDRLCRQGRSPPCPPYPRPWPTTTPVFNPHHPRHAHHPYARSRGARAPRTRSWHRGQQGAIPLHPAARRPCTPWARFNLADNFGPPKIPGNDRLKQRLASATSSKGGTTGVWG